MAPCSLLRFLVICYFSFILLAKSPTKYYGGCPLDYYNCGEFGNSDTYNSECGLKIRGCDKFRGEEVQLGSQKWYKIIAADLPNDPYSIIVQDKELQEPLLSTICNASFNYGIPLLPRSTVLPLQIANIIILHKCNRTPNLKLPYSSLNHRCSDSDYDIHYNPYQQDDDNLYDSFNLCSKIHVPVDPMFLQELDLDPFYFLSSKLHIQVNLSEECVQCYKGADICNLDNGGKFHCRKDFPEKKLVGALNLATKVVFGLGVLLFFLLSYYRFNLAPLWKNISKAHQDFEAFLKSHGPLAAERYSYSEIKKKTNSFKENLGQGGFGAVYKGKLQNGCRVAVKILSESKGNGEEFLNEVASISRTSHVNIVTLLGFCFEGSKRALVYEFMPNGSLEKFIYEANPLMNDHQLDTKILYQIAIGVARGLEYLHRGCNTRIFHLDIKPHNILLDENFCPKISDFGLAKICLKKESIVSMQGTRGTIGYIAPEVFNRNFGEVSHKSDVYSYGMMVLEMVSGRKNINTEVNRTSEIYFPHWIYKRLELDEEFALRSIRNDNDRGRTKKMLIVSLWCIQTNPADRPIMGRVVEMLEGGVETLQIPPKPFLSSPQGSPPIYSTHNVIIPL